MPIAGKIHYRRSKVKTKTETPLLLIHGAGGSYLSWPAELRHLAGEDVLAIDLPGHGDSPGQGWDSISAFSDDLLSYLDQMHIDRAVLCGHSMGGAISLKFSLDHPERVKGLILIGSGAAYAVNPKLIEYCENASTYPQALQFVVKYSFSREADQRLVQLVAQRLAKTAAGIMYKDFLACDAFDVRDQLGGINLPTLVICGEEDRMMPLGCSQLLAEGISGSCLEIVPAGGHMVMLERPEAVAQLVHEFLKERKSHKNKL